MLSNYILYIFVYSPNDTPQVRKKKLLNSSLLYNGPKKQSVCGIVSPQILPSFDMSQIILCIERYRKESTVVGITMTYVLDT